MGSESSESSESSEENGFDLGSFNEGSFGSYAMIGDKRGA